MVNNKLMNSEKIIIIIIIIIKFLVLKRNNPLVLKCNTQLQYSKYAQIYLYILEVITIIFVLSKPSARVLQICRDYKRIY